MHNYTPFTQQFRDILLKNLDSHLAQNAPPHFAAFDADGTLWATDAGEAFFEYEIKHAGFNLPRDPWKHYFDWKAKDPIGAYYWLAQINQGLSIEEVRKLARNCVGRHSDWPVFYDQKWLISELRKRCIKVFVVTASVKWAVEPFAELVGLTADDVLGIETKVENGIVTDIPYGEPTYKKGKSDRLLRETNGVHPIFCSGNTMGDFELLKSSKGIALAVTSAKPEEEIFKTEMELQSQARLLNWLSHKF